MYPILLWKVTICCVVYLGIPGFSLVGSKLLLGAPNRHNWSQQLERQWKSCRGHGEDERLGRQVYRQWCRGSVEPWDWAELPGGPGHLSSLRKEEDYLVWWGKDVWWVQSWIWKFMPLFQHVAENAGTSKMDRGNCLVQVCQKGKQSVLSSTTNEQNVCCFAHVWPVLKW